MVVKKKKSIKKAKPKVYNETLSVVGIQYRITPEGRDLIEDIIDQEGKLTCSLELEPENEVDPDAIKVVGLDSKKKRFTGTHLGYIRRPVNRYLAELLEKGARVESAILNFIEPESGEGEIEVRLRLR